MLSKNEIKDIQSLGLKKQREARGLFLAEGPKIVGELLQQAPAQAVQVYALESWLAPEGIDPAQLPLRRISEEELERITQLQTPNGVLAVFRQFEQPLIGTSGLSLYLDRIQDPGNFGTLLRIADWFGLDRVVCSAGCAELYNPKVVQATMASIARVAVHYDEGEQWLKGVRVPVLAASLKGSSLYELPPLREGVLLIGNESKGLSEALLQRADQLITIPRKGGAESLNAAVAAGILLSHLIR
jgi:TrmH family RNA methyltransferase